MVISTHYQTLPMQDENCFYFGVRKYTTVQVAVVNCGATDGASVQLLDWMAFIILICCAVFSVSNATGFIMNYQTL